MSTPDVRIVETLPTRMMNIDTDQGIDIIRRAEDMKALVEAYRRGVIKERKPLKEE